MYWYGLSNSKAVIFCTGKGSSIAWIEEQFGLLGYMYDLVDGFRFYRIHLGLDLVIMEEPLS